MGQITHTYYVLTESSVCLRESEAHKGDHSSTCLTMTIFCTCTFLFIRKLVRTRPSLCKVEVNILVVHDLRL